MSQLCGSDSAFKRRSELTGVNEGTDVSSPVLLGIRHRDERDDGQGNEAREDAVGSCHDNPLVNRTISQTNVIICIYL